MEISGLEREPARSPRLPRARNELGAVSNAQASGVYQERVADFYSPNGAKVTDRNGNSASAFSGSGYRSSASRSEQARTRRGQSTPVSMVTPYSRNRPTAIGNRPGMTQSTYVTNAASVSVGIASVIAETVLAHPLIVLRRQCQVSTSSRGYHLGPFSVLPVTFKMVRNQGPMCLTKGLGTSFVLRGASTVLETTLAELLNLPREVTRYSSAKQYAQFVGLKLLSGAVLLPFYAAHLTECVQSDVVGERTTLLDFFHDSFDRTVNLLTFGALPQSMRVFPLWKVLLPASLFFASHFIVRSIVQHLVQARLTERLEEFAEARALAIIPESPIEIREPSTLATPVDVAEAVAELTGELPGNGDEEADEYTLRRVRSVSADELVYERFYIELISAFVGALVADIELYAAETVVNRLCVQGTRTLIDDVATGVNVVPIAFHYSGVLDAARNIFTQEGVAGFYRGFGALLLQYSLHLAVIKLGRFAVERFVDLYAIRRNRRSSSNLLRLGVQKYKLPPRRNRDDDE